MSKELQKDEFILPGNLGTVNGRGILKVAKSNGSITLTISGKEYLRLNGINETEDADFEIIPNQKIEWRDLPEDNEAPTLSRNLLDEAGLWKTKLITTPEGGKTD